MSACIWVHEEALSLSHPVFKAAPEGTEAIFIWDDHFFQTQKYSLKRLVFIYECLSDLGITCVEAPITTWLIDSKFDTVYVASSYHPVLKRCMDEISLVKTIHRIDAEPAFKLPDDKTDYRRFFAFWRDLEKTVLAD
jgi:hypothetical protein